MNNLTPENLITWIVFGAAAGWIAEAVIKRSRHGSTVDIVLGIVGAVAGGIVLNDRFRAFMLWDPRVEQAVFAVIGAAVLLVAVTIFKRLI